MASPIAEKVFGIIKDTVENEGVTLWDVKYVKEGASWYLRVILDSEEGISIDDCTNVHHAIDPVLDEADPIESAYYLEVSSPGIERELRTDRHIEACIGCRVEVRLYAPLDGAKTYVGVLAGFENGAVTVETAAGVRAFEKKDVAKIRTLFDFGD